MLVLIFKFTDKLDFRRDENRIALSNLSIYYTWKNIKSSYNNNRFRISASTLPVSDIQGHFECILKKNGENIDNQSVKIYVKKMENIITFRIKNGYSLEL